MALQQKIVQVIIRAYNNTPSIDDYLKSGWLIKIATPVTTENGQEIHYVIEKDVKAPPH